MAQGHAASTTGMHYLPVKGLGNQHCGRLWYLPALKANSQEHRVVHHLGTLVYVVAAAFKEHRL